MVISLSLAEKLQLLVDAGQMPASKLGKHEVVSQMRDEGIVSSSIAGRTKETLYIPDIAAFHNYLHNRYGITSLQAYIAELKSESASRAGLVAAAGDSKVIPIRTFTGFLVNSYMPVDCTMNSRPFLVNPQEGSFMFIYDYQHFLPAPDVTIVGVENAEVFGQAVKLKWLFHGVKPLFISRYPQQQGKDALRWLQSIPNSYLHLGDYDFAGINIYLQEYRRHLGSRATFLLPGGIDKLIAEHGSRTRYDTQRLNDNVIDEPGLLRLVALLHQHKKCLDQEILLRVPETC